MEILDNDIRKLRHDISIYETHLQKTEIWIDNLGKWTTNVKSASVTSSNDTNEALVTTNNANLANENTLLFEIHVELHDGDTMLDTNKENMDLNIKMIGSNKNKFREGWIIYRSIKQFESLHESLSDIIPSEAKNKFKKIPSLKPGMLSKSFSEGRIKQATLLLDDYLKVCI
jgi:hypothetical protein